MRRIDDEQHSYTEFIHESGGSIILTHNKSSDFLIISDLVVPRKHSRSGIGKLLVAQSIPLAYEIDSTTILAGITSMESLCVMRDVFGEDAINVRWESGEFGKSGITARAGLRYDLPDMNPKS